MATTITNAGPWDMTVFVFDEDDTGNPLGTCTPEDMARIPFGAVELDRDGGVVAYYDTEPEGAGPAGTRIVGRSYFDEILSWNAARAIGDAFRAGVAAGHLNAVFDCAVPGASRKIRIHLKISPILGTYWVFVKKLAGLAS